KVTLSVITKGGCSDSIVVPKAVAVGTLSTPDFSVTPSSICAGEDFIFTDLSVPADRWLWNFGDDSTSLDKDPKHAYLDTGKFTIKLTVWNNGCSTSVTKSKILTAYPPVA